MGLRDLPLLLLTLGACESTQDRPQPYQTLFRTADSAETREADRDEAAAVFPRDEYPVGPFGLSVGEMLRNYELDSVDGPITIDSLRRDTSRTVLWIVLAAPWCPACRRESPDLVEMYEEHHADGLEILGVVESDISGERPDADDAVETYSGAPFPVGADTWAPPSLALDSSAAGIGVIPVNLLVDLDTLRIWLLMTGWDRSRMEAFLDAVL